MPSIFQRIVSAAACGLFVFCLRAAPVTTAYTYTSTLTSDANGRLDLVAELSYDDSRSNAPIAVVMHGYSGTSGLLATVRANAQYLRDKGFFAVSVALRNRDGSDGIRDSGGLEIYDIYDAVEAVKAQFPERVNPDIVYITGYSGGGGNTMAALSKFPNAFNAGAAYFGMSDYGYHRTDGWYFKGASDDHRTQMRTDMGDPTLGNISVTDRYHARASNLASANNPYSEIHLFVNSDEPTCPPVNMTSYYSNAVSQAAFAGEFSNITVHIGQAGLYQDFNSNGLNEASERQYWPHGYPTVNQQAAAETWFMDRLLAGQIPRRALNASDSLVVAGFVKTSRFDCRVGDGQQGAIRLDYTLASSNMTFQAEVLSLDKQQTSRLTVDTRCFSNQMVDVILNGARTASFAGGSSWTTAALRHGDTLELRAAGPAAVWWEGTGVTNVGSTCAVAVSTLAGSCADVWCFWGTNDPGQQRAGWWRSALIGSDVVTGKVSYAITNLVPATAYHVIFCATNAAVGSEIWSGEKTFTTLPNYPKLLVYYDFETELNDQTTNACHGASVTAGGKGVTFTNQVPAALAGSSSRAGIFDGASWVRLPFLNLYGRARTGGVSVSVWVRGGAATSWILAEGSTENASPAYCFGSKNSVPLSLYIRTDNNSVLLNKLSAGSVFDTAWHHLVWTDQAGTVRLYIDGAPADTAGFSYTPGTLTLNTTTIGGYERSVALATYPFAGWMDDLAIWNEVLGTNVIQALSSGVSPLEVSGLLSDPAQPVQITDFRLSGTHNLSLTFSGPTRAVQPRPWYTTSLLNAVWSPLPGLTAATKTNTLFAQSFDISAINAAACFYKIVYTNIP